MLNLKLQKRFLALATLIVALVGFGEVGIGRLAAQGTAAILGTITDTSGATVPDATIQIKNVGTGQLQSRQSDAQGRYNAPDLGVGDYEVQASKEGFATLVHKGITLTVGSQNVIDFSLTVGQTQQTVTVEGAVTQVETTNATVGALVDQAQMRELPLNGRDFEQLMQLAPGVQNYYAGTTALNMREGKDAAISIAGGRPEGTSLLMDDQVLENYYNRGLGSITGTSLGVESIGEFQTLTNTYGAQFGGNGAVMNAVTKSGTNSLHGSGYEFLRNSDMDARNFTDPSSVPEFRRNQYGGSLGGPIKKDKAFFFLNYEGITFVQGVSQTATVPTPTTSTAANPATAAAINAVLAVYPRPTFNINTAAGTGQLTVVKDQTGTENYGLGRVDYNLSDKDAIFGRYFVDLQNAVYPFQGGNVGLWPELDSGSNQFFSTEERHIFSPTVINIVRASFSRINSAGSAGATHPALQLFPGAGRPDATIAVSGLTTIGTGGASPAPVGQVQNRYSEADDVDWTVGAHTLRFGASVNRIQSGTLWPYQSQSSWSFASIPTFLAGTAKSVTGATTSPANYPIRDYREIDFTFYGQDDWKVTPKLTLNLGVRYQPTTNPIELRGNISSIVDYATDTGFTTIPHVLIKNPSLTNFDPRFGFAYDLFANHKTSIRGGFGIFHDVLYPGVWAIALNAEPPWSIITQTSPSGQNCVPFQNPSIAGGSPVFTPVPTCVAGSYPTSAQGSAYQIHTTPYMIQYNLNIQHDFGQNMVGSVGYVGSHGVNLITGVEDNPVPYTIDASGVYHFAPTGIGSGRSNPNLGSFPLGQNGTDSRYNSLQASLNRRLTRNVQAQASYTFSRCLTTGEGDVTSLAANSPGLFSNPYNRAADFAVCAYNVTHAFRLNGQYNVPLHGNRLIEGWQLTGILAASTGLPFNVTDGVDESNMITGVPRPNYSPNNPAVTIGSISYPACNNHPILGGTGMYFNPNCFSQEAFGTLGNFAREGLVGPGLVNLDLGILKTTRIRENVSLQFRGELFNVLNHTNLSYPASALFTGTPSATATLGRVSTAGQITTYAAPSREIQLGLKLIF